MKKICGFIASISVLLSLDSISGVAGAVELGPPLRLEINTVCVEGAAEFRIANAGEAWPANATFMLYRMGEREPIVERSLRLVGGQGFGLKIDPQKSDGQPVALWVDTKWYPRPFKYDAVVHCR